MCISTGSSESCGCVFRLSGGLQTCSFSSSLLLSLLLWMQKAAVLLIVTISALRLTGPSSHVWEFLWDSIDVRGDWLSNLILDSILRL